MNTICNLGGGYSNLDYFTVWQGRASERWNIFLISLTPASS